jgi:acetyl-CoA acetyltransferase family protein
MKIAREDQDRFALASQEKAAQARADGSLAREIVPVSVPRRKADPLVVDRDEHPRDTSLEKLAALRPLFGPEGTVTAGNASGVNDGAAALLVASEAAVAEHGLTPRARFVGAAAAGVPPRIMGMGPVPATRKLLERLDLGLDALDVIELNEAFASQALACLRELGLAEDDPRVNPLGGAIALGHPLGMSGARLLTSALHQVAGQPGRKALCTMCVGVGQGMAGVIEAV